MHVDTLVQVCVDVQRHTQYTYKHWRRMCMHKCKRIQKRTLMTVLAEPTANCAMCEGGYNLMMHQDIRHVLKDFWDVI